jgi:hypothetical protein
MHTKFWSGNLEEGDHLEDLRADGKDNIKMDPKEIGWTGLICFRIRTIDGLSSTRVS